MQTFRRAGEDRALFGAGFIAYGDHEAVKSAAFEQVERAFGLVPRDVDAVLLHDLNDARVQNAGLQPGALGFKPALAKMIEVSFGHLTAGAVVYANEKNSYWTHIDVRKEPEPGTKVKHRHVTTWLHALER